MHWSNRSAVLGSALALLAGCADTGTTTSPKLTPDAGPRLTLEVPGNPTCAELIPGSREIKFDGAPAAGTIIGPVTITAATGTTISFTSAIPILGVVMKGGNAGNFYDYRPNGVLAGQGLVTPDNASGGPAGISHISFCYVPKLVVTKTANTTFDRDWDWTINKANNSGTTAESPKYVAHGQSFVVTYTVSGGATPTDHNFAVSGTISIVNPLFNGDPAIISGVSDVISGGIEATVNCGVAYPYALAAGATLNCTYSSALPDAAARVNTATATVTGASLVAGAAGTANVTFGSTPQNQTDTCINLEDTLVGTAARTICVGDLDENGQYSFTYTYDVKDYQGLVCNETVKIPNVASFLTNNQNGEADDAGSATSYVWVKKTCDTPRGDQGCTPGYWKQPHHLDSWVGYDPGQTVESVFDLPGSLGALGGMTLLDALDVSGGGGNTIMGASRTLLRAAVAALLNASSPGVDYPMATAQIISDVNEALASGNRNTILKLAGTLDGYNNLGCPLD
jgi:hypothetical protein